MGDYEMKRGEVEAIVSTTISPTNCNDCPFVFMLARTFEPIFDETPLGCRILDSSGNRVLGTFGDPTPPDDCPVRNGVLVQLKG